MDAFRTGFVYVEDCYAGTLSETEDGYRFAYDADYLSSENPRAVSLTLPLRDHHRTPWTHPIRWYICLYYEAC